MAEQEAVLVAETLPASPTEPTNMSEWKPEERQHWRDTGETPKKSDRPSADKPAAASEPAKPQEKKTQTAAERKAQLQREIQDLVEKKKALEAKPETKQEVSPSPAAKKDAKPKLDDKDDKGNPKFKTYEEWEDAKDDWVKREAKREFQSDIEAKAKREAAENQERTVSESWNKRITDFLKETPDFAEILKPEHPVHQKIGRGSIIEGFILDSEQGPKVLHHLAQNPEDLDRIQALNPFQQNRELIKLEGEPDKKASPAPVTRAPKPVPEVGGRASSTEDELMAAAKAKPGILTRQFKDEATRRYMERNR